MIVLDGGIGSEMDKRTKISENKDLSWCANYHLTNEDVLREVYEDFYSSGARLLSANTYSVLQYLLKCTDEDVDASVAQAIRILQDLKVQFPDIQIAGCISAHNCRGYSETDIRSSLLLLASCLAKHKIDYVLVEMIQFRSIGKFMIDAANLVDSPTVLGFSVVRRNNDLQLRGEHVMFDSTFLKYIISNAHNIKCVGIMHSDISVMNDALYVIEKVWSGDLILYPDCGVFAQNIFTSSLTEKLSEEIVVTLLKIKRDHPKLKIVGGCCGLGPSYIQKLSESFKHFLDA